jgi:hypothetical protein
MDRLRLRVRRRLSSAALKSSVPMNHGETDEIGATHVILGKKRSEGRTPEDA